MSAIVPAVLPKSRDELDAALARLSAVSGIEEIQIDVVDGRFAAPASWPYGTEDWASAVRRGGECLPFADRFAFDIDLMVADPERAAGPWLDCGARRLTLHLESMADPGAVLAALKRRYGHETGGAKPFELGLAVNVGTELALLTPLLPQVDYVQLMGIAKIGRQGEPFDERVLVRVRALRAAHPTLVIQVDGGVSRETAPALFAAGATRLVVGHAIVRAGDSDAAFAAFAALVPRGAHAAATLRYTGDMALTDADLAALGAKASEIRQTIVEMLISAGSGHTAGPLGMADIFTAFYFHILRHDPQHPDSPERDRLILSNGHIVPVRYAAMAHAGYFPVEECLTLRKFGSRLQGHPERLRLPGLETTSGPLGEGLAQAAGIAYALKMLKVKLTTSDVGNPISHMRPRVYCVMGDGEQDEGSVWEAFLWAGKQKLDNLTAIIDRNNIQIDGMTEVVMPLEPLAEKYRAFNWHVIEVNGNDIRAFIAAVDEANAIYEKPVVIIAHTIPGKGVKEIEFDYRWHGVPPGGGPEDVWKKAEQGRAMLAELRTLGGRVPHDYA